jgi:uncharacterized membrane protein (DUF485 family)
MAACVGDTLILDGEVVELEVDEIAVNTDSLNRLLGKDVRKIRRLPRMAFSLFPFGVETAYVRWNGVQGDSLVFLEQFMGTQGVLRLSASAQAEASVWLNDYIRVRAGVYYTSWNTSFRQLNPANLVADSARFGFFNDNGRLLQYYRFPVGVGFETDTLEMPLAANAYRSTQWAIPFGMRVMLNPQAKTWQFYADIGGVFRITRANDDAFSAGFLNSIGQWESRTIESGARNTRFFQAQIRLGASFFLSDRWYLEAQSALVNFPSLSTAEAPWLSDRLSSWGVNIGVGYIFMPRQTTSTGKRQS